MERSSVSLQPHQKPKFVEVRFTVSLPARGRTILGRDAADIFCRALPEIMCRALMHSVTDAKVAKALQLHVQSVADQEALRAMLPAEGLIAFVRNGAILPRASGEADLPMSAAECVPFEAPETMRCELKLPHSGEIVVGMGVRQGVNLIVGGGFHGKSTLLQALEVGCYNHVPGDGREFVTTSTDTMKVRAEDGRSICGVDISPFINNLPFKRSTRAFSTPDASGSTSQAANIMESLEAGAKCLLMDEDTCATNFMVRDKRMQALVARDQEPITPFISRVRALYDTHGVSTVLVIGGCGAYFDVADSVLMMLKYKPRDVTADAKAVSKRFGNEWGAPALPPSTGDPVAFTPRVPAGSCLRVHGKVVARTRHLIQFGDDCDIDLSALDQLIEESQTRSISHALQLLGSQASRLLDGRRPLTEALALLERSLDEKGLDVLNGFHRLGDLSRPRRLEVAAALNRFRKCVLAGR